MAAKQAEAAHLERELARMTRARDQMAANKGQRQTQVAALASGYQAVAGGVKLVGGASYGQGTSSPNAKGM